MRHQLDHTGPRVDRSDGFDADAEIEGLRRVVDQAIVPAFLIRVIDPEGDRPCTPDRFFFEHFNEALVEATGFAGGVRLDELLNDRAAEGIAVKYCAVMAASGTISYQEDVETPSGAAAWQTTLKAKRAPSGATYAILGFSADITDRRERELADAEAIARLRRTADEVRVFASMAAHDIRGPLATIESLVALICLDFVDKGDGKRELLDHLSEVTATARSHMDELLQHSTTYEDVPSQETAVDLGHLCRDLAALHDPDRELEIVHPQGRVFCDRVALHLVLRNLLSNARRHCTGRIEIACRPCEDRAGMLCVTVADDGPGFPVGMDPFRADRATRAASGHGYGLAAVSYVVETRGGHVEIVRGGAEAGGTVTFTLPGRLDGGAAALETRAA